MGKFTTLIDDLDAAIDLDQAYVARDILEQIDGTGDSEVQQYFDNNSAKVDKVREDIAFLTGLLQELNTEEGWTQSVNQKDGTKVYFKKTEDESPMLMTKLETLIPCPTGELPSTFIALLSIFNETDLMPKWFPYSLMKSHESIVSPTPFTKMTHVKIKLPFPLSQVLGPRDCVIQGKGYDLSERAAAAISVRPLDIGTNFGGVDVPAPDKGWTRFTLRGAYYFEMRREGIVFKQMQQLDLKSKMVPTPVMNWLAKGSLPLQFLGRIKGNLDKFGGSEWEKRVSDNTDLYPDVENRLREAVKREFGIEAVSLRDSVGKLKRKKTMRARLSNLGLRRKKKVTEDVEEEFDEPEPEPVELLDTTTEVLRSIQKVAQEMFERCTASLGTRIRPTAEA